MNADGSAAAAAGGAKEGGAGAAAKGKGKKGKGDDAFARAFPELAAGGAGAHQTQTQKRAAEEKKRQQQEAERREREKGRSLAPQVQINADGEIVVNAESLVMEAVPEEIVEDYSVVYEQSGNIRWVGCDIGASVVTSVVTRGLAVTRVHAARGARFSRAEPGEPLHKRVFQKETAARTAVC